MPKKKKYPIIANTLIDVGPGSIFLDCENLTFKHCTFHSNIITSAEIFEIIKNSKISSEWCKYLGTDSHGSFDNKEEIDYESDGFPGKFKYADVKNASGTNCKSDHPIKEYGPDDGIHYLVDKLFDFFERNKKDLNA